MFTLSDVADKTGIPVRRIKWLTDENLVTVTTKRTGRGRSREYTPDNIVELLTVNRIFDAGVKLESLSLYRAFFKDVLPGIEEIRNLQDIPGIFIVFGASSCKVAFVRDEQMHPSGKLDIETDGESIIYVVRIDDILQTVLNM